ncbi:MAG: hypothetical protein ACLRWF_11500 [Ruthenibacterium sp.]
MVRRGQNASKATVAKHATAQEYRASTPLRPAGLAVFKGEVRRIEELFAAVCRAAERAGRRG